MVIRALLNESVEKLKLNNIENAIFDANLILRSALNMKPIDLVLSYNKNIDNDKIKQVRDMIEKRCANEPLQYILGTQEFMGLEFNVNNKVLVPRADTEALTEAILELNCGMNVLDICTGSGCIAISIAHYNKNAFVLGVDISDDALLTASENAEKLSLSERVRFEKCDIMKDIPSGTYDIIVSNPPYIKSGDIEKLQNEVKLYEPHIALDGGEDGLNFYRRIIKIAPMLLKENGKIYFEVGYDQSEQVLGLMKENFKACGIKKDLCGVNRVVYGEKKRRSDFEIE